MQEWLKQRAVRPFSLIYEGEAREKREATNDK